MTDLAFLIGRSAAASSRCITSIDQIGRKQQSGDRRDDENIHFNLHPSGDNAW